MDSKYSAAGWRLRREGGFCLCHLSREQRLPGRFRPVRQGHVGCKWHKVWPGRVLTAGPTPGAVWPIWGDFVQVMWCSRGTGLGSHLHPSGHSQTTPEVSECLQQPPSQPLTQMLITPRVQHIWDRLCLFSLVSKVISRRCCHHA